MSKYFNSLRDSFFRNKSALALGSILIIAFLLRIWGINFGLPHIYHTDEWFEVKRALKLGAGVFDFGRTTKGGYFYLLFVEYGIYYTILKIAGIINSSDEFLYKFFQDPSYMWLIGRVTTAIIGTLNVYIVYLLGKRVISRTAGFAAAFILAIHFLHVRSSHFITVDIPLTCMITLCFLIMVWKPKDSIIGIKQYCLLGIVIAISVMIKITGAVIILPVFVFHFMNIKSESSELNLKSYFFDKRFLYCMFLFLIVYISGNPGIIFQIKSKILWFFSFFDIKGSSYSAPAFAQPDRPDSLIQYYFGVLFPYRYILFTITILGGIILVYKKKLSNAHYLFLSFLIPYMFFLSTSKSVEHVYPRYALPIIPILSVFSGLFFDFLVTKFRRISYGNVILPVLILSVIYPLFSDTIIFDKDLGKPDTRAIAKIWVHKNIPSNKLIIIEGSLYKTSATNVPLKMNPDFVDNIMNKHLASGAEKSKFYTILKQSLKTEKTYPLILIYNSEQLNDALDNKIGDFIIIRESLRRASLNDENIKLFPNLYRLVSWTESDEFDLIKTFEGDKETKGPKLLIYKRN
jgi:hypothetical protein